MHGRSHDASGMAFNRRWVRWGSQGQIVVPANPGGAPIHTGTLQLGAGTNGTGATQLVRVDEQRPRAWQLAAVLSLPFSGFKAGDQILSGNLVVNFGVGSAQDQIQETLITGPFPFTFTTPVILQLPIEKCQVGFQVNDIVLSAGSGGGVIQVSCFVAPFTHLGRVEDAV